MSIGAPRYVAVVTICHIARNGDILAVKLRIGMISSIYFKISGSLDLEPRNVTSNLPQIFWR